MKFIYPKGATPYTEGDFKNLIPSHVTLQSELNEWEQANILEAEQWAFSKSKTRDIFALEYIKKLHYKMFDKTWRWAGKFRQHQTNIGCVPYLINTKLSQLLSDISYYIEHQTYEFEEIAIRLHHGLVLIHCFPNGNGRHARMMADLLLVKNHYKRLSWGNVIAEGEKRSNYISALKKADVHDFSEIILFAKS